MKTQPDVIPSSGSPQVDHRDIESPSAPPPHSRLVSSGPSFRKTIDGTDRVVGVLSKSLSAKFNVEPAAEEPSAVTVLPSSCRMILAACIAVAIIVVFFFYGFLFCIYKICGTIATFCHESTTCCSSEPRGGIQAASFNPCSCCYRLFFASQCYLFYFGFGGVAYVFYILSCGPLWLLSLLSPTYAEDFATSKFSLYLDDDEFDWDGNNVDDFGNRGEPGLSVVPSINDSAVQVAPISR